MFLNSYECGILENPKVCSEMCLQILEEVKTPATLQKRVGRTLKLFDILQVLLEF